jgi:hypothetical protein
LAWVDICLWRLQISFLGIDTSTSFGFAAIGSQWATACATLSCMEFTTWDILYMPYFSQYFQIRADRKNKKK